MISVFTSAWVAVGLYKAADSQIDHDTVFPHTVQTYKVPCKAWLQVILTMLWSVVN